MLIISNFFSFYVLFSLFCESKTSLRGICSNKKAFINYVFQKNSATTSWLQKYLQNLYFTLLLILQYILIIYITHVWAAHVKLWTGFLVLFWKGFTIFCFTQLDSEIARHEFK